MLCVTCYVMNMKDKLQKIKKEILDQLAGVKDLNALKDLELKYLSRKGEFTSILKSIKDLNEKQKKEFGQLANVAKKEIQVKIEEIKNLLEGSSEPNEISDVTLLGEKIKRGHLNPLSLIQKIGRAHV